LCTSSSFSNGGAILSSAWPSSYFEVVAHKAFFAANLDIFYMFAEMSNDEHTEMQLKFQGSRNSSVFVTTLKVGGTAPNLTVANHAVITPKF
jgi:SNF2 family DNA or RNA helicase